MPEYLIVGMGSMLVQAEAVADYLRDTRKRKVGVVNVVMWRPLSGRSAQRYSARAQRRGCIGAHGPAFGRGSADHARDQGCHREMH